MANTITNRQTKEKELLLGQLRKMPIVQLACEKSGVGRATYYRWRKDDKGFTQKSNEAIAEGSLYINDLAESQLLSAIRDKNLQAIFFWLKTHHPTYTSKLEVTAKIRHDSEELTPEQAELVQKALKLAGILTATVESEEEKT